MKKEVSDSPLKIRFGSLIDKGFTAVPNVLLDHGHKVGISDHAMYFIVQSLWLKYSRPGDNIVKDADFTMQASKRTMIRIRKELEQLTDEAGNKLVHIKSFYQKTPKGVIGYGTEYDFQPLLEYVNQIDQKCQNGTSGKGKACQNVTSETKTDIPLGQNGTYDNAKMAFINEDKEGKKYKNGEWFKFKIISLFPNIDLSENSSAALYLLYAGKEIDGNVLDISRSENTLLIRGNQFADIARSNIVRFLYEIGQETLTVKFVIEDSGY